MRRGSAVSATVFALMGILGIAADLFGFYSSIAPFVPEPLRVMAPWAFLFLCFCVLWWEVHHPPQQPDVAALHVANTNLQIRIDGLEKKNRPRRLDQEQQASIAAFAANALAEITAMEPPESRSVKFLIEIVAGSYDQETIDYRNDLAAAFEAAGFGVGRAAWHTVSLAEQGDFAGKVTLLRTSRDEANRIRPIVKNALARAGIQAGEKRYPAISGQGISDTPRGPDISQHTSATVLVGPR